MVVPCLLADFLWLLDGVGPPIFYNCYCYCSFCGTIVTFPSAPAEGAPAPLRYFFSLIENIDLLEDPWFEVCDCFTILLFDYVAIVVAP